MTRGHKLILLFALTAMVLGLAAFLAKQQRAPALTLRLLGGPGLSLESLKGQVVIVHFWSTTCGECEATLGLLAQQYRRYQGRGLETLAITSIYDQPAQVASYAYANNLPFKIIQDDGSAARAFALGGANPPLTFLLDRHGRIKQRLAGRPDPARLQALVEKLLAEAP